jgi:hypothetical protein
MDCPQKPPAASLATGPQPWRPLTIVAARRTPAPRQGVHCPKSRCVVPLPDLLLSVCASLHQALLTWSG